MKHPNLGVHETGSSSYLYGVGLSDCAGYLDALDRHRAQLSSTADPNAVMTPAYGLFTGWAEGYMSSYNVIHWHSSSDGEESTMPGRARWLENYCKAHPLEQFVVAVGQLTMLLAKPVQPK